MDINAIYNVWCEKATEDKDLIEELKSIKGNEEEIVLYFNANSFAFKQFGNAYNF